METNLGIKGNIGLMALGLVRGCDGVWMLDSGGCDLCRFCGTVGKLGVTGVSGDAKGVVGG